MSQPLVVCAWKEYSCKNPAKAGGFCGLHVERGVLLNAAKEKGVRVCDDGKRGCRNETLNHKSKCEECLLKVRQKENSLYNERKAKGDLCTMCGMKLETLTKGINDTLVQKCEKCYASISK